MRSFVPELKKNGWVFVKYLSNGIQVWENPDFTFLPSTPPPADPFKSFSWGIFPLLSFFITMILGIVNLWKERGEKIIRNTHAFVVGLIPLALGFWYYKIIFEFKHKQVYFTYDHALFFLSDALVLIAVMLWLAAQVSNEKFFQQKFTPTIKFLFVFCCLLSLSAFWSADWRTSTYIAIHFWLIFGLILSMRDWHTSWNAAILGLCAALSIQALTGIVGFISQSTLFLSPLNLHWPGPIDIATRAASIVKLPDGQAFLRAYGTLPHPNILGGFGLVCLTGPIALFLRKEKPNPFALILLAFGSSLLALTFSRSAWIAAAIFLLTLIYRSKLLNPKRTTIILLTAMTAFGLTIFPLRELFLNRVNAPATTTEEFSLVGRAWLTEQAFTVIKEHPLLGVGSGSFIIQLAERAGEFNFVEPVHNIPLLITSELGVFGLILILMLMFSIGKNFLTTKNPNAIIIGALLMGLGAISLFDHYLWTLAPGRLMLGFVLGLWEGQIARDK